ncbi:peptide/nickel transport system ATP-binding protein [Cerasibacillus quisquiliarum]|uniref:Oligopeptide ABC transporter ATP-binding protein OppF n=1 Tax=Cerasibacillus quisquiliarum TaxID=227865 RepID=A0A511UXB0_9BACI|nr:dipeptide ABC transporter ATP-binding protein [Cerasibacillus quisquiliarum]MBB5145003.1 peptide/nickel transport system ATP-binding protein [Cerasibacillus quisquiliarum]GEN30103.1 oligopeptide ABC transporter ATP-binding protein OppF [Cerasibacillus quisquiliarum]
MNTLLTIKNLHIHFETHVGKVQAVRGVDLSVKKGETLAIVGESGSGKSVTAKSIIGLLPKRNAMIDKGEIWFENKNLLTLNNKQMKKIRGAKIAMIFQDPMTALNPTMKVGKQVMESAIKHLNLSKKEARNKAVELLNLVGISNPETRLNQYPHEFSGGMRQRIVIAMALSCNPKLLIADEPTTALDVTIQAQILDLLKHIQKETGTAIIFITHDLGVVSNIADSVAVMYAGKIIEKGTVEEVLLKPNHPYSWGLLKSMPNLDTKGKLYSIPGSPPDMIQPLKGDAFAPRNEFALAIDYDMQPPMFKVSETHYAATWLLHPQAPKVDFIRETQDVLMKQDDKISSIDNNVLLEVKGLSKYFYLKSKQTLKAVDNIHLEIRRGETLGLVGESGCGKSTVGRTIIGLHEPTSGEIIYDNTKLTRHNQRQLTKKMQMIFQDPYSSLDPKMKVEDIIAEGLDIHHVVKDKKERKQRVEELLKTVGLQPHSASRYPHEFSGGQRQRIGIARALAIEPEFIVADEPISALDVSIQAQVINLLLKLQKENNLTLLFIAHDLSMVKYISDRIGVMYLGTIVELANSDELYKNPLHPYTQALLSAIPNANPIVEKSRERIILKGTLPSPVYPPSGCRFRTRCLLATDACEKTPEWREVETDHWVACHYA